MQVALAFALELAASMLGRGFRVADGTGSALEASRRALICSSKEE